MVMNKKALIIGNWKYSDKRIKDLKSPKKDIEDLKKHLEDINIGAFDVQILKNPNYKKTVEETQNFFRNNQESDNLLLLYFSGYAERDITDNSLYFYSKNSNLDNKASTSLSSIMINELVNETNAAQKIIIIDSCFANYHSINDDLTTLNTSENSLDANNAEKGFAILSASRKYDLETEKKNKQNSLFTHFLLEGIESGEADFDDDGIIDINDIYLYTYNKMKYLKIGQRPVRRINSSGIMSFAHTPHSQTLQDIQVPVIKEEKEELVFNEVSNGWEEIDEFEMYSFFVLYLELEFKNDQYKIDQLWNDHIENFIFHPELESNSQWKQFCGNNVSKKRIYIAPVTKNNIPVIKSIFKTFLTKQVDDIRLNQKDIKNKYYFTAMNLKYKTLDSSARLIPSCSNIYKLAEKLEMDKLYLSKDVIELLPPNLNKNLQQIKEKSDIFSYSFNLLT